MKLFDVLSTQITLIFKLIDPLLPPFSILFYKGICPKVHRKIDISVFCIFCFIFFDSKGFLPHRSIRLIDTVLLIPILPYFMTFHVTWHMS